MVFLQIFNLYTLLENFHAGSTVSFAINIAKCGWDDQIAATATTD
jgi:hypothetical protein